MLTLQLEENLSYLKPSCFINEENKVQQGLINGRTGTSTQAFLGPALIWILRAPSCCFTIGIGFDLCLPSSTSREPSQSRQRLTRWQYSERGGHKDVFSNLVSRVGRGGKGEKVVRSEGKGIRQRCPGKALRVRGSDLILESRVGSVSPVFSVLKQDQWVSETCLAELQLMRTHSDSSFSARWSLCAL